MSQDVTIDDETLVAYLDGELPGDQLSTLETRLDDDVSLRERLDALRQSFDMLSELPQEERNPDLARSTIELVALQIESEESNWWSKLKSSPGLLLLIGCICTLGIGSLAGLLTNLNRASQLRRELPAMASYPALKRLVDLRNIEPEEALQQLVEIPFLTEAFPGHQVGDVPVPTDKSERQAWLDGLAEVDRGLLLDNANAFRRSIESERSVRELADYIMDSPDKDRFLEAIHAYDALMQQQSPRQIEKMELELEMAQWRDRIISLVGSRMGTVYASDLSKTNDPAEESLNEDATFTGDAIVEWIWSDSDRIDYFDSANTLMFVNEPDAEIIALRESLSEKAQQLLAMQSPPEQRLTLGYWTTLVVNPDHPDLANIEPPPEELEAKLQELGNSFESVREQDRILLLPEAEAREELQELIQQDKK